MRSRFLPFLALPLVLAALPSRADWPMPRHDPQRTAVATGSGDLAKPVPYWRAYLGGRLATSSAVYVDANGDGALDVIYAAGGRLVARTLRTGAAIWEGDPLELVEITAVDDLDGDGTKEVVARSSNQIVIVDLRTGAIRWREPEGEMGGIGAVRVGDLDGDKRADLVIVECGNCAATNNGPSIAYSFGAGYGAAKKLWQVPKVSGSVSRTVAILDADGDGVPEVAFGKERRLELLRGATGDVVASSADIDQFFLFSFCTPVDLDRQPGEELLCYNSFAGAAPRGRRVFALKFAPTETPAIKELWSRDIGDVDGSLTVAPELHGDLDGDGTQEVFATGVVTGGLARTFVLSGSTGETLATLDGTAVAGVAAIEGDTGALLLTNDGAKLEGHRFDATATPKLSLRWSLPGHTAMTHLDPVRARTSPLRTRTLTRDVNGDGVADLLTLRAGEINAYSGTGGKATILGTYKPEVGTEVDLAWPIDADGFVAVGRSDGRVLSLGDKLLPVGVPSALGGYYSTGGLRQSPVVSGLGAPAAAVFVPDSRGYLLRVDAAGGALAVPVRPTWARRATTTPTVVPTISSGSPGLVAFETGATHGIVALRPNGSVIWSNTLEGLSFLDLLPGRVGPTGAPGLLLQWGRTSDLLLYTRAIGLDGAPLWNSTAYNPGSGRQPNGWALHDWNGDGKDDAIFQAAGLKIVSGADGTQLANATTLGGSYNMPIVKDVDGDGASEITLHARLVPVEQLASDLRRRWSTPADTRPFPLGALVDCAGAAPVLVHGSLQDRARITMTTAGGPTAGTTRSSVLAGGRAFADEAAARAAGARLGQLGATNVHVGLTGANEPVAVVGSTDGWLYGLRPCTGALAWSYDFGAPVGEAVFGDTDGDGKDEIVVSVADGYLYGVKHEAFPPPAWVWDLDPASSASDADVDATTSTTTLAAKWAAVPDAIGYDVAVFGAEGYLTAPAWKDVGNVTSIQIDKLVLRQGLRYSVAVRARGASGTSPDVSSDGVEIVAETTPDAGVDAGDAAPDASDPPDADAGVVDALPGDADASTAGVDPITEESGGCGCRVVPERRVSLAAVLGVLSLGLVLRRRRR
jgi:hypothetical protein